MNECVLAPINVNDLYIVDCTMHLEKEPARQMSLSLNVETHKDKLKIDGNGLATKQLNMSIEARLLSSDDPSDCRFSVSLSVNIEVSILASEADDSEEIDNYLNMNAASIAYGHARSAIMTITGLSPLGAFVIPAVMPNELIK